MPESMRAWAIDRFGDNSVVRMITFPRPKIAADEILVQIKAASINPLDFKIRNGELRRAMPHRFPFILGNECAGVVVEKGAKVTRFNIGDEVYTRPHKTQLGTLAEFMPVKEEDAARKPKGLSFEEAAGLPLVGLTSWQVLIEVLKVKKGDRVFIPAGSGGVGTFAVQLAKHLGAFVATNTSAKNLEFVKSLGADQVIDYKTQDFSTLLSGFDYVFDTMGGETQKKAFSILKPGGTLLSIVGPPTVEFIREIGLGLVPQLAVYAMSFSTMRRASSRSVSYKFFLMRPDGATLEKIANLIDSGVIKPVLDRTYPFEQAADALKHVESGHARGKVVVKVTD